MATQSLMDLLPAVQPAGNHGSMGMSRDDQERYLLSLLTFGLERVAAEPERLANESLAVKKETESHAVDNYSAFLQSAVCVRKVREELEHSGRLLHELAAEVPNLERACAHVQDSAGEVEKLRKDTHTMAKQHNQLLQLLEVPQLMDTAVRNDYYDEALELAAFAKKASDRHPGNNLLVGVKAAVQSSLDQMQAHLLLKLQSNIQLPVCLSVIAVLRRLGRHSDAHLRYTFLECRDRWLSAAFDEAARVGSGAAYPYLCKVTDLARTHMFEIITQYRAIFLDWTSNADEEDNAAGGGADAGLLYAWANARVTHFSGVLERELPRVADGSQIASLLEKVMYCGAYLGREGLDLRGAVTGLFETRLLALCSHALAVARDALDHLLVPHRLVPMPAAVKSRYEEASAGVMSPPAVLLDHPPLAVLSNKLMDLFNELRECAIVSVRTRVADKVGAMLAWSAGRVVSALVDMEAGLSKEERKHFIAMIRAMKQQFFPFISECLKAVFDHAESGLDLVAIGRSLQEVIEVEEEAERKVREEAERVRAVAEAKRQAEAAAREAAKKAEDDARQKVEGEIARKKAEAEAEAAVAEEKRREAAATQEEAPSEPSHDAPDTSGAEAEQ